MGFWIFMCSMNLLIPLILIGFGRLLEKHPPKQINFIFGYRTKRSAASPDAWYFAQVYFGRLWFRAGLLILPFSVLGMLPVIGKGEDPVAIAGMVIETLQLIPLLVPIFLTERQLRRRFDSFGNRRQ